MAQSSKQGLFASVFGSRKKTEEELEAQKEFHRKLEDRIREALMVNDPPPLEPALECARELPNTVQPAAAFSSNPSAPAETVEYSYLHPATGPESLRKPPSPALFSPALRGLSPAAATRSR